ncbi:MAG: ATP-binding cassette domain-containing protein [Methylibium sp.]|nr:ATP-binding cassette domain-containing protein [Methylibium sp.]
MIWDVDVTKRFEHAGRRFDLQVSFRSDARRLVLFGPSGAGKSQTLKMIAGLTTPDTGRVCLAGRTLFDHRSRIDMPPQQRAVAYMFQDYALFPHLTVRQNIAFALHRGPFNPGRDVRHAAVQRWLDALGLGPAAQHYPEQLSGGQRQRTALARALVAEPRALLLDEPFAALDRALRARLRDELRALQAQLDIPLLLITHDEDDLRLFGDEVLHIAEGRLIGEVGHDALPCLP